MNDHDGSTDSDNKIHDDNINYHDIYIYMYIYIYVYIYIHTMINMYMPHTHRLSFASTAVY